MVGGPDVSLTQDDKTMGMLGHLLGFFTKFVGPLVIYLIKRDSKFVSFHSLQQLFFQIAVMIGYGVAFVLTFVGIGLLLYPIVFLIDVAVVAMGCIKAFNGEWWEIPVLGPIARRSAIGT
jgi:uncharacterized membrane protein